MTPEGLIKMGVLVVGAGMLFFVAALLWSEAVAEGRGDANVAVVGLAGFVPVGIASDRRLLLVGLPVMAALAIISLILWRVR